MLIDQAHRYIKAIRNPAKRAYAEHYWAYLVDNIVRNVTTDSPQPSGLTYMAAQAVRLNLHTFTEGR